jgi:nicotinamidase-related amidase
MPRRDEVVAAAALLARSAGVLGIPVIVTRQYPQGPGETLEAITHAAPDAVVVDKVSFSCPAEPAFRGALDQTGRRQVVLAGMETHICVAQTALALQADGFQAYVVADATCSRRDRDATLALERLRAEGVVVTAAESVIYEALGQAGTPAFRSVLEIVKAHPLA